MKLGMTESERRDYIIIMTDPIVAANYWNQRKNGQSPGPAPQTVGLDNNRDEGLDELKVKLMAIFVRYDELREGLNDANLKMPGWVTAEFNQFKLGKHVSTEPHKAADFVRRVLADPRAMELTSLQKGKLIELRDFLAQNSDFIKSTVGREDAEFAKRDRGMADEISKLVSANGLGLAYMGGSHESGVVARLTEICRRGSSTKPAGRISPASPSFGAPGAPTAR